MKVKLYRIIEIFAFVLYKNYKLDKIYCLPKFCTNQFLCPFSFDVSASKI